MVVGKVIVNCPRSCILSRSTHLSSTKTRVPSCVNCRIMAQSSSSVPVNDFKNLPIRQAKKEILSKLQGGNQVLIITGETGSGKSTRIPLWLHEAFPNGKVVCTQPRRLAAKMLARRVASTLKTTVGNRVGYWVRWDKCLSNSTCIEYVTDGIFLHGFKWNTNLDPYSAIMIDEAHERSLSTEIVLSITRRLIQRRPDLKVIISSATIDTKKFSKYFANAPVVEIPGRQFPLRIFHVRQSCASEKDFCVKTAMNIHHNEEPGDILIFLSGMSTIEKCCEALRNEKDLWVLPLHSALTADEQKKVFEPKPSNKYKRKVVVATSIAETSITIEGIHYVVDSGLAFRNKYDPQSGITTISFEWITQAQAIQRAGRTGRTSPGKVYRGYSEQVYKSMAKEMTPAVQRCNLDSALLTLASHGIENIYDLDFLDPLSDLAVGASLESLQDLGAFNSRGKLTTMGREMARLPLDPQLSKVLIASKELECMDEALSIVSALAVNNFSGNMFRPASKGKSETGYNSRLGDHFAILNCLNEWKAVRGSTNHSRKWCAWNRLNFRILEEAILIREALENILGWRPVPARLRKPAVRPENIQQCIAAGFFAHIARRSKKGLYVTYSGVKESSNDESLAILPKKSVLTRENPKWIMYHCLVKKGSRAKLVNVMSVEPGWIQVQTRYFFRKLANKFHELRILSVSADTSSTSGSESDENEGERATPRVADPTSGCSLPINTRLN